MSSEQIKLRIQNAYRASLTSNTFYSRSSTIDYIFRDIHLFGREAGSDFIHTFSNEIVEEAVAVAKTRQPSMHINVSKSGKSALEGVAQALRDLTGLTVEISHSTVTMTWADETPRML